MGLIEKFLPKEDRFAALLLYGMVFSTCFNGLSSVGEDFELCSNKLV